MKVVVLLLTAFALTFLGFKSVSTSKVSFPIQVAAVGLANDTKLEIDACKIQGGAISRNFGVLAPDSQKWYHFVFPNRSPRLDRLVTIKWVTEDGQSHQIQLDLEKQEVKLHSDCEILFHIHDNERVSIELLPDSGLGHRVLKQPEKGPSMDWPTLAKFEWPVFIS